MSLWNRRSVLTGLDAVGANLWLPPSADALGLGDDKIKVIRYFSDSGDSVGPRGQPMVNQSSFPAGREKLHSLGTLDLALWDLKTKALDEPVW
jgi:L-alanine-DL-glutamate epimerase-like enolase superfamily enzyme